MSDQNMSLTEIDMEYERLIARMDSHIDRLAMLEEVLTTELEQQQPPVVSEDWLDELETQESDDERHVFFDDVVMEIDSDSTVEPRFTPFYAIMNSDSDSDTETVVLDYQDPSLSPDIRFVIRHPIQADAETDSDDDFN